MHRNKEARTQISPKEMPAQGKRPIETAGHVAGSEKQAASKAQTYLVDRAYYSEVDWENAGRQSVEEELGQIDRILSPLKEVLPSILNQRFIMMKNKKVWMDTKLLALYPKPEAMGSNFYLANEGRRNQDGGVDSYKKQLEGFTFETPTFDECSATFRQGIGNPYVGESGKLNYLCSVWKYIPEAKSRIKEGIYYISERNTSVYPDYLATKTPFDDSYLKMYISCDQNASWSIYRKCYYNCSSYHCYIIPICHLASHEAADYSLMERLECLVQHGLIPEGLEKEEESFKEMGKYWKHLKPYLSMTSLQMNFDIGAFRKQGNELFVKDFDSFKKEHPLASTTYKDKEYKDKFDFITLLYQYCDFIRANISPYDEKRLTDINLGHWELVEEPLPEWKEEKLPKGRAWVARPPQLDVRSGVCAIDFGTKSTVVACRDENQDERLRRVGKGGFNAAPRETDYENPTAVELRHYESFRQAYNARNGRPFTKWQDMTVSHEAVDAIFKAENTGAYYSVFNELKQWANDPHRRMFLSDQEGKVIELKPYNEIREGDFDPIEIYAYYLGLYINNMTNGIYLDYIMSFPVNYSVAVRERIRQSFERGIRKSLPPAILADEEVMKHFRIQLGCSEPAAYAITALQEFGLEPKNEEDRVAYAVFDFGGGTTDFDFGIASLPAPTKRYNLQIDQFGYGGDPYLGGENILMLMAYEVFRENVEEMRKQNIHMVLPSDGVRRFTGSEVLVEDSSNASQQACLNTRELQRSLRPIWEKKEDYKKLGEDDQSFTLYSSGDGKKAKVMVKINISKLEDLIKKRIERGVESFFVKLTEAFDDADFQGPIHIFLAGNSCKSPVVQELFKEYIKKYTGEQGQGAEGQRYKLYLPLGMKNPSVSGTEKAKAGTAQKPQNKTEAKGAGQTAEPLQVEWDRVRTGKTGVAFGLLRCRKGARDVKVINKNDESLGGKQGKKEVKFPYYLGHINRNHLFQIDIGPNVEYGEWAEYIDASEDEFELRYTQDARAQTQRLPDSEVSAVSCYLDEDEVSDDADVAVFVRKKDMQTLEYAVGSMTEVNGKNIFVPLHENRIHECKLK